MSREGVREGPTEARGRGGAGGVTCVDRPQDMKTLSTKTTSYSIRPPTQPFFFGEIIPPQHIYTPRPPPRLHKSSCHAHVSSPPLFLSPRSWARAKTDDLSWNFSVFRCLRDPHIYTHRRVGATFCAFYVQAGTLKPNRIRLQQICQKATLFLRY